MHTTSERSAWPWPVLCAEEEELAISLCEENRNPEFVSHGGRKQLGRSVFYAPIRNIAVGQPLAAGSGTCVVRKSICLFVFCRCVVDLDDVRGAVVGSATASDQAANSASMVTWTQEGAMPDRLRINRMHE